MTDHDTSSPSQDSGRHRVPGAPNPLSPSWSADASGKGGLDPKVGGLLAYLLFGWIGGLIMYLTQSHREVRFHGAQSVLLSIVLVVVYVALGILGGVFAFVPGVGTLFAVLTFLANTVIGIGSLVLWIILCIKGYNLEHFKLPIIGEQAERWAAK